MPRTFRATLSADEIAEKASRGEDISANFGNELTGVRLRRVNADLSEARVSGVSRDLWRRVPQLDLTLSPVDANVWRT